MTLGEIFLILSVIIVVFKPEDLPGLAVNLGKLLRKIRHFTAMCTKYLDQQVQQADVQDYAQKARQKAKQIDDSQN